ncbi:hypothetical protein GWK47_041456 [Chionoecetes opilio]|uniref:FLYWCH-type domain-containing protein n=1 Tax=Chionoecetes opilio TaxID=41210 RepID=A0A8J5D0I5_CHIOP|nr:hypothetical protein GWK47_041456 [Chionoecetes opilio]
MARAGQTIFLSSEKAIVLSFEKSECQVSISQQEALVCDGCMRWQHRTCGSGVTRKEYRAAVKEGHDIDWMCNFCRTLDTGATPSGDERCSAPDTSETCIEDASMVASDTSVIPAESSGLTSLDTGAAPADDHTPSNVHARHDITYEKVISSTQGGQHKVIDSLGYAYTMKRKTRVAVHWRCVVRNNNSNCRATIKEADEKYVRGHNPHCHPSEACPAITSKVSALVKKKAVEDVFRSATDIVEEVFRDKVDPHVPLTSLPAPANLARQGNRKRRATRPAEPPDLTFEISNDNIPQHFLQHDIFIGGRRNLLFSTHEQLSLLSKAKHWYADATFKIVRRPFTQLFSFHADVQYESNMKQVPLLFALMSGKRRRDYKKVLFKLKNF